MSDDEAKEPFQRVGHRPGRFTGDMADIAAADAIGQYDGNALQAKQRLFGNENAVKVLIGRLAPLVRMLADRDFQVTRHINAERLPYALHSLPHPDRNILTIANLCRHVS